MRRWLTIVIAAVAPRAAHAGGALEELSAGGALAPGSGWISNKLAGTLDLNARLQVQLDLSSTRVLSTPADTTRGDVYLGSLLAVYSPDDHWSLRLTGSISPESTTQATQSVNAHGLFTDCSEADVHLRATVLSRAFGVGVDYDSAADDVHALSASLSINATYFNSDQTVINVQDETTGMTIDLDEVRQRCAMNVCNEKLAKASRPQWAQLAQLALGASVTDTIEGNTDLSLDASYYLYDHDPLQSGYLGLASIEDGTLGSATSAPLLRDTVTPSLAHRWGAVAATVSLSHSDYVDGEYDVSASVRVQYKLALAGSRRLKIYTKLAGTSHTSANAEFMRSGSLGFGAQYTW